jgi:hypothetical protein
LYNQQENINYGFEPEDIRLNSSDEMYFDNIVSERTNEEQNNISVSQIFANDDPQDDDTLMS